MKSSSHLSLAFSKLQQAAASFVHHKDMSQSSFRSTLFEGSAYLDAQRRPGLQKCWSEVRSEFDSVGIWRKPQTYFRKQATCSSVGVRVLEFAKLNGRSTVLLPLLMLTLSYEALWPLSFFPGTASLVWLFLSPPVV